MNKVNHFIHYSEESLTLAAYLELFMIDSLPLLGKAVLIIHALFFVNIKYLLDRPYYLSIYN